MQPSTIPSFDEQRWPLRGAPYASIAFAVITLGLAAVVFRAAVQNDTPLEVAGRILLGIGQTKALLVVIGCLVLLATIIACVGAWRGREQGRSVTLDERGIEGPASAHSARRVQIAYASLTVKREGRGPTLLRLRGPDQATIILADQDFHNREAFDDFAEELDRRLTLLEEAAIW